MCESAAPSTTNQKCNPRIYIKDKVARKSLQAYSIKMQYEIVFKSDRKCSCYTCLPPSSPAAQTNPQKVAAPGTPPMAQRLLTITQP